jgi:tetratricopeptide (TPR) repeat protein
MKKISLSGSLTHVVMVIILLVSFIGTGCGPSQEEIMAREQARLQAEAQAREAEEARRQAEETRKRAEQARLAKIRAAEVAGNEAARQGQSEKALAHYQQVLRNIERYSDQDQRVRQAIIKVVLSMPAPPPLPEGVMRSMVRAETKVKMGGAGSYEAASKEMEQAVLEAPWFADAYFNLGIVQEKAGKFGEAAQNLQLCLLAAPQSRNAAAIKAKIYELELMKEEEEKIQALQGSWNKGGYTVTIEGGKIRVEGNYSIQVDRKGRALEGFITISGHQEYWLNPYRNDYDYRGQPCQIPGETVPVTGVISEDGRTMEFRWMQSKYQTSFGGPVGFFADATKIFCSGVALVGKEEKTLKLEKSNQETKPSSGK